MLDRLLSRFLNNTWLGNLLDHYFRHDVARESASLTYYLFFAIFPLLIFISTFLGLMHLDIAGIAAVLKGVMPGSAAELIESYLVYVTENSNSTLMWFSLFFSIYFPFRATNTLMRAVRRAYHVKRPTAIIGYNLKVLIFTAILLVTLLLGLLTVVMGRQLVALLMKYVTISGFWAELWLRLRFVLLAVVVWGMVALLYGFALDRRIPTDEIYPGALFALVCWMGITLAFSFYVENFANYSLIYGSIGAVIVVLVWLNLTAMLMIMGAEYNVMRMERKEKKRRAERSAAEKPASPQAEPQQEERGKDLD